MILFKLKPMTKSGVHLLKRHNVFSAPEIIFLGAVFFLFSCSSSPKLPEVEILDCVDLNSSFTVHIPVRENEEFVNYAFVKLTGADSSSVEKIIKKTDRIVICSSGSGFEGGACVSFPSVFLSSAFTEKNGWKTLKSQNTAFEHKIYSSTENNLQISHPAPKDLFFGTNIEPLLKRYETNAFKKDSVSVEDFKFYDFLMDVSDGNIRFCAPEPKSFISRYFGKSLNPGITSVKGILKKSKSKNLFALEMELEFQSKSSIKAAAQMIKLALFPVPAKIQISGSNTIVITDISLSYRQLLELMGT